MDAIQLELNGKLVKISSKPRIIQQLKVDDEFLQNYILKAVKSRQFSFIEPDTTDYINIKRITPLPLNPSTSQTDPNLMPVWCKKGKPNNHDADATALLITLRSTKYKAQFDDKRIVKNKIWQEIADELHEHGYDVDSAKCQQKFLNLTKAYVKYIRKTASSGNLGRDLKPPDFFTELHDVLKEKIDNISANDGDLSMNETITIQKDFTADEDDDNDDTVPTHSAKKFKLSSSLHDYSKTFEDDPLADTPSLTEHPRLMTKIVKLMEAKVELLRERNGQRQQFLELFERLVDKF